MFFVYHKIRKDISLTCPWAQDPLYTALEEVPPRFYDPPRPQYAEPSCCRSPRPTCPFPTVRICGYMSKCNVLTKLYRHKNHPFCNSIAQKTCCEDAERKFNSFIEIYHIIKLNAQFEFLLMRFYRNSTEFIINICKRWYLNPLPLA